MRSSLIAAASLLACATARALGPPPATPVKPVSDTYFGTAVVDPYRWLEDAADSKVQDWTKAQGLYARSYLDSRLMREPLKRKLTRLITGTSPSFFALQAGGPRIFALYNDPRFQQPRLVWLPNSASPSARQTVLDPNRLDPGGLTAIDWFRPSHDGSLVAVSLSHGGSEDGVLHVYEADTGKEVGAPIPRVQYPTAGGSLAWAGNGKGFWYTRYPGDEAPEADRHFYLQVFFHKLETDWSKDELVLGTADGVPRIGEISLDNRYAPDGVLASVQNGDGGEWSHWLIGAGGDKQRIDGFKDKVVAATVAPDHSLILVSRNGAPRGKVLRLPANEYSLEKAQVLVPEGKASIVISDRDEPRAPTLTPTTLLVSYIDGGPEEIRAFGLDGEPRGRLGTPEVAALGNIEALSDGDVMIGVSEYLRPGRYLRWHGHTGVVEETGLAVKSPVSFADAEVVRAYATSKDGTRVPLTILLRKGTKLDGHNPALLYGYGGYGLSQQPHFAGALVRSFLDAGGIYAEANIRGGSEYGEAWHDDGRLLKKQNVFDDFAAAAGFLVKRKYTSHARLALMGGSNGGLLMGAQITQHPAEARAVVSTVGIYDMLRVERDPNGAFNTTEFGSVNDPAQFKALYAYSPYHHVVKGTRYPAVLLATGAHDGRVNPMQSRKFCAALQAASRSGRPVLLRISTTSGHGIGSSLTERIEQQADTLSFLFDQLGMKGPRQ